MYLVRDTHGEIFALKRVTPESPVFARNQRWFLGLTDWKFNIALENQWLEDEISFGNGPFFEDILIFLGVSLVGFCFFCSAIPKVRGESFLN